MRHIKKFNEQDEFDENESNIELDGYGKTIIRVEHLIEYLSKLDPKSKVLLDKDGWMSEPGATPFQVISDRGLFHPYSGHDGEPRLMINN